ncbi:hypothetical protein GCM10018953_07620 [Streptosporangium nondiastaticum]|uniref:hypothetical protein n=1 Tax=Streptosporangium nondiastaticum TaxID=35764 RepID=UPI0031F8C6A8
MREPVGRTRLPATALRIGAVLAASGPVILTALGIGGESLPWFCSATVSATVDDSGLLIAQAEAPYALGRTPGEFPFWGVLLLPVVVVALLRRGSRRAVLTAAAAVGVVLALDLLTAFLLPGLDPCTGRERAAVPPWPLISCYPVAAGALLMAARSPLPPSRRGIVLWAGAVGAAALLLFPLLDIALYIDRCGGDFPTSFAASVRWHLLLAAVLVAVAVRYPETRSSGTGVVRLAWRVVRGQDAVLSRRARDLTVAVVVAAAVVWLVSSSFTPTR